MFAELCDPCLGCPHCKRGEYRLSNWYPVPLDPAQLGVVVSIKWAEVENDWVRFGRLFGEAVARKHWQDMEALFANAG